MGAVRAAVRGYVTILGEVPGYGRLAKTMIRDKKIMEKNNFSKNRHAGSNIQFSIKNKILMLSTMAAIPFLIVALYLLMSMLNYSRTYDDIVNNLTVANNYNLNFKEEMDESLYKLVVGYVTFENISEDGTLKNPYDLIDELQTAFTKLKNITTEAESKLWLESLLRNIGTLEKRVDDIMQSVADGSSTTRILKSWTTIFICLQN
ncbi:MAG: hypothetical protein QM793_05005 [Muricomes sp.]